MSVEPWSVFCLFVAIYGKPNSLCNLFVLRPNSFYILFTSLSVLYIFSFATIFSQTSFLPSIYILLDHFILISLCLSKSFSFHLHPLSCLSLSTSISLSFFLVEGQWLEWGPWSRCSVTCNTGTQQRQRRCSASVHGWAECKGPHQESRDCTNPSCSGKPYK